VVNFALFYSGKGFGTTQARDRKAYVDMKITNFHARSSLSQPCRTSAATFGASTPIVPRQRGGIFAV
jgi:triphosphoribosyl-dephospho-CoA synthetase